MPFSANTHRPVTNASGQRIVFIAGDRAQRGDRFDAFAQSVGRQSAAPWRKGQIQKPFDLGPVGRLLLHQTEHGRPGSCILWGRR